MSTTLLARELKPIHTLSFAHNSVDDLQSTDGKSGSFTSTGLGLRNGIATFADLNNGTRLDSRRGLVTVGVDTAKQAFFQVHILEGRRHCDLLGGVELHPLCAAVSMFRLDYALRRIPSARLSMPSAIL